MVSTKNEIYFTYFHCHCLLKLSLCSNHKAPWSFLRLGGVSLLASRRKTFLVFSCWYNFGYF